MPPAKKPASRRRATAKKTARKRPAAKEPAAIKRLNKSLDAAQEALVALRKDVSRGVGAGGRRLHKDLQKFVKDARRDTGRLSKALERDIERLQKRLSALLPGESVEPVRAHAARRRGASTAKRTTDAIPSERRALDRQADHIP